MRTDGALKLILNVAIFSEMPLEIVQERYVRFSAFESPDVATALLLKASKVAYLKSIYMSVVLTNVKCIYR